MTRHRVLVTGATGFIGRHLVPSLLQADYEVVVATRKPMLDFPSITRFPVDFVDENIDWSAALDRVSSVVHLAGRAHRRAEVQKREFDQYQRVNVAATEELGRKAAEAGIKRFIYLSSIAVNGSNTTGRKPFSPDDPANPRTIYGRTKLEAELSLVDAHAKHPVFGLDLLRCPVVIGPGARGNMAILEWALRRYMPMPFSSVNNRRAFISIDDLTDFILLRLRMEDNLCQRFTLASPDLISTPELVRNIAAALSLTPILLPFPRALMRVALIGMKRRDKADAIFEDLEIDTSVANGTGWRARTTIPEAVRRAYELQS